MTSSELRTGAALLNRALQGFVRQVGKNRLINLVFAECRLILPEANTNARRRRSSPVADTVSTEVSGPSGLVGHYRSRAVHGANQCRKRCHGACDRCPTVSKDKRAERRLGEMMAVSLKAKGGGDQRSKHRVSKKPSNTVNHWPKPLVSVGASADQCHTTISVTMSAYRGWGDRGMAEPPFALLVPQVGRCSEYLATPGPLVPCWTTPISPTSE